MHPWTIQSILTVFFLYNWMVIFVMYTTWTTPVLIIDSLQPPLGGDHCPSDGNLMQILAKDIFSANCLSPTVCLLLSWWPHANAALPHPSNRLYRLPRDRIRKATHAYLWTSLFVSSIHRHWQHDLMARGRGRHLRPPPPPPWPALSASSPPPRDHW